MTPEKLCLFDVSSWTVQMFEWPSDSLEDIVVDDQY